MPDYEKMYFTLFHAITEALEALSHLNVGEASDILSQGQQNAENIYMSGGGI